MPKAYFAYGSNMDHAQMARRCPDANLVGKAKLVGYRFARDSRGAADIKADTSSTVYGLLWTLSKKCEDSLDRCEGVGKKIYRKDTLQVIDLDRGTVIDALVYVGHRSEMGNPIRDGYMEGIIAAALEHGFPQAYVQELRTWLLPPLGSWEPKHG